MTILRVTAVWNGFRGAPGYSNFYFEGQDAIAEDALAAATAVRTFFNAFRAYIPQSVSISIQPTADNIDEQSGNIVGQVDFAPPTAVTGGGLASYSAASGAVVNWNTAVYLRGRRVRGRTFLVPLASDAYDSQGDLGVAPLGLIRGAATALVQNPGPAPLMVWSRSRAGLAGSAHQVISAGVPDLGAVLRSRRD